MRDRGAMVGLRGEGREGVKGEEEKREGDGGEWRGEGREGVKGEEEKREGDGGERRGDEGGGYKGRGKRWR